MFGCELVLLQKDLQEDYVISKYSVFAIKIKFNLEIQSSTLSNILAFSLVFILLDLYSPGIV